MESIGAIVLAAGGSVRFGSPKQLLEFRGQSLLRRVFDAATTAGCSPIVVVIGAEGERITAELRETSALVIENDDWRNGIGTSIRAGVEKVIAVQSDLDAVVLLVCDQPFVDANAITRLIARHDETKKPIVASSYSQTLGVPALFERTYFNELLALDDKVGAKNVILSHIENVAEYPFPDGAIDIDTSGDYERLIADS
ncbi:MAG: nucleotidyltransferase family protein [Verrucomicrobiota bacterium]|nr:nucleotidyltransferase family protein [Verrucomicrobiota bacterium]